MNEKKLLRLNSDAKDIDFKDLDYSNFQDYVVTNSKIKDFLSYHKSSFRYIVAPKGVGKTHLLLMKSVLMRKTDGLKCFPEADLVANIGSIDISLTRKLVNRYKTSNEWSQVWQLILLVWLNKQMGISLPKEIQDELNIASSLESICEVVLPNFKLQVIIKTFKSTFLVPSIKNHIGINQFACFIDNVDQSLTHNLKNYDTSIESKGIIERFWCFAQAGLLLAAEKLSMRLKNCDIFLSVRREAYTYWKHEQKLQIKNKCVFLNYDEDFVKQIVENRILQTHKLYYRDPNASDIYKRLTGFEFIPHTKVRNSNGKQVRESLIQYVFRHTFERPREVLDVLQAIVTDDSKHITINELRNATNSAGNDIFEQLKEEIHPSFDSDIFLEFCKSLSSNIFSRIEAESISEHINTTFGFENYFSYLYRIGLIGIIKKNREGNYIQHFNAAGHYSFTEIEIPDVPNYMLHPSTYYFIEHQIKNINKDRFLNSINIVGNNLIFNEKRLGQNDVLHVHFGLDQESTGLIIPEICEKKPIFVISKREAIVERISQTNNIEISLKHGELQKNITLKVVSENDVLDDFDNIYEAWSNYENFAIVTENETVISKILSSSNTVSFSRFYSSYLKFLNHINAANSIARIYFIDRYRKQETINSLKSELSVDKKNWTFQEIPIIFALCERVFLRHDLKNPDMDGSTLRFDIIGHNGSFIIPNHSKSTLITEGIVLRTNTSEEFDFYDLRNRYLHEGIYQFYKLLHGTPLKRKEYKQGLLDFFLQLQIWRIYNKISPDKVKNILHIQALNDCSVELRNYSLDILSHYKSIHTRWDTLSQKPHDYIRAGVLPKKREYLDFLMDLKRINFDISKSFSQLLKYKKPFKGRKASSIFISYSTKDQKFADSISSTLESYGLNVFLFTQDKKSDHLRKRIYDMIHKTGSFLFLSSTNSLLSDPCQNEILVFRKKQLEKPKYSRIFCLSFDESLNQQENLLKEFDKSDMKMDEDDFLENVEFLKSNNTYKDIGGFINRPKNIRFKKFFQEYISENFFNINL